MPNCLTFYSWVISEGPVSKQVQHRRPSAERCCARPAPRPPRPGWLQESLGLRPGLCCVRLCVAQAAGLRGRRLWSGLSWLGCGLFHFLPLSPAINASGIWGNICQMPCTVWCTCQVLSFETLICADWEPVGVYFRGGEAPEPWDCESGERDDGSGPG